MLTLIATHQSELVPGSYNYPSTHCRPWHMRSSASWNGTTWEKRPCNIMVLK